MTTLSCYATKVVIEAIIAYVVVILLLPFLTLGVLPILYVTSGRSLIARR